VLKVDAYEAPTRGGPPTSFGAAAVMPEAPPMTNATGFNVTKQVWSADGYQQEA
jgi:hypothetical protein